LAEVYVYRTYPLTTKDQDPILDEVESVLKKEKLEKKPSTVANLSGVSTSTLRNWLISRTTRCPRYSTVAAVFGAIGYQPKFERTGRFDLESERIDAKRWQVRRKAAKLAARGSKGKKSNGSGRHLSA